MSISRKEFFRQGVFSLGKAALELTEALQGGIRKVGSSPEFPETFAPEPCPDKVSVPDNQRCLARSCGCFACIEQCRTGAIALEPGQGIRIDGERCTGCGACEFACPVVPRAVFLVPRAMAAAP